jgi:signal transduction histidine kinase
VKLRKFDVALAAGAAALDVSALLREPAAVSPLSVAVVAASCAALLARRRFPLVVLAVALAAQVVALALGDRPFGAAVAVSVFTLAERGSFSPPVVAAWAAAGLITFAFDLESTSLIAVAVITGFTLHTQRETWAQRDEIEERAALRERTAIARELHDIVAHSVSVMLVGVRGARDVIATEPQVAYATLGRVEASAERSLAELRRSLDVLRDPAHSVALAPQPSLRDLEPLFADAGLPVRLHASGALRDLPDGLELSVYRLVQEALTNVRKHANASRADVFLRFGEDTLGVEIVDDGVGDTGGDGQGLVGMRERVAMLGGELEHGSRPDGGYRVAATLPIP